MSFLSSSVFLNCFLTFQAAVSFTFRWLTTIFFSFQTVESGDWGGIRTHGGTSSTTNQHKAQHSMTQWSREEQGMLGFSSTPGCQSKKAGFILRAGGWRRELVPLTEEERHAHRQIYIHTHTHELAAWTHPTDSNTHIKTHTVTASQPPESKQRPGNTLESFKTVYFLTFLGHFLSVLAEHQHSHKNLSFYPCKDSIVTIIIPQPPNLNLSLTIKSRL